MDTRFHYSNGTQVTDMYSYERKKNYFKKVL